MKIIQVALPIPVYNPFNYKLPNNCSIIKQGCRVLVPFRKKIILGITITYHIKSKVNLKKIKRIKKILDKNPLFSKNLLSVLIWMSKYYHKPIGEILFYFLPLQFKKNILENIQIEKKWKITRKGIFFKPKKKISLNIYKALKLIKKIRVIHDYEFQEQNIHSKTILSLKKSNLIYEIYDNKIKNWMSKLRISKNRPKLNSEQINIIKKINSKNKFFPWLLAGITGSGKTEIYLNATEKILKIGRQVLILVPEINLIPQIKKMFVQRFNVPIDIFHSYLKEKKKLNVWIQTKIGNNAIIIGTRSALFTSFKDLGLIIVDEEHDSSYKQKERWCYHARDVAVVRAKKENIPIIMGSATPSIESILNAKVGKYFRVNLTKKTGKSKIAKSKIIDLSNQIVRNEMSIYLISRIEFHLKKNNQVMLFLNRRGYAPLIICYDCKSSKKCFRCSSFYTLHLEEKYLKCHYCESVILIPKQCSNCGSTNLNTIGFGTEKIEEIMRSIFPKIPITRIDKDTAKNFEKIEEKINKIHEGESRILIGTQMIAKGHHFPNVTLVALLNIDGALFSNDYRATEKLAQLYTQVSGRAGRGKDSGEVILQTCFPNHPFLRTLLRDGYYKFIEKSLKDRKEASLPPYSGQISIYSKCHSNKLAIDFLKKIKTFVERKKKENLLVLGPIPFTLLKKSGLFRWKLVFQHPSKTSLCNFFSKLLLNYRKYLNDKKIRWIIDVDPIED
ncbi:hypothetical protein AOQ88_01385 [Candidatus Riesia sp. GBBU]|nr:hypothetical protein AOQ88_01385 [Candidatus Riesia sp. GBBU]